MLQRRAKTWPYSASRNRAGLDAHPARKAAAEHAQQHTFRNNLSRFAEDRTQASIVVRPIKLCRSWKPLPIASIISAVIEHRDIQSRLRTAEMANARLQRPPWPKILRPAKMPPAMDVRCKPCWLAGPATFFSATHFHCGLSLCLPNSKSQQNSRR